jgi:dTDP-4-amino-4,6-dideoxygalactose transaminase
MNEVAQKSAEGPAERQIALSVPKLGDEEWHAVRTPLESGWLTQGPKVREFEEAFAERHRVPHAVAVTSGTAALHAALYALGIGPGDEVIVPAFSWVATANAALYVGADPVFVDVERIGYNIDLSQVATAITERTRAVVAVHLFGLCVDFDRLRALLPDRVAIIEDAACAAGAAIDSRPAGSMGAIGCFSFHPRKSITTGEGGMLTMHSGELAECARVFRNHGASPPIPLPGAVARPHEMPKVDRLGYNFRMSDIQAAIGIVQLTKLDTFIDERDRWAHWYQRELADIDWLACPSVPDGFRHAWQAFVVVVDPERAPLPRNEIMARLHARGIATRPGTHAITELDFYRRRFGLEPGHCPTASFLDRQSMAIPLHNRMTAEDYEYVVAALRAI